MPLPLKVFNPQLWTLLRRLLQLFLKKPPAHLKDNSSHPRVSPPPEELKFRTTRCIIYLFINIFNFYIPFLIRMLSGERL